MENINTLEQRSESAGQIGSPRTSKSMKISLGSTLNIQPQNSISVVSLFSGCGGMDLGFLGGFSFLGKKYDRLPFNIVWANEINEKA